MLSGPAIAAAVVGNGNKLVCTFRGGSSGLLRYITFDGSSWSSTKSFNNEYCIGDLGLSTRAATGKLLCTYGGFSLSYTEFSYQ
jgi:hypothetical protein